MKLKPYFLCAVRLQKTERPITVKGHLTVCSVMAYEDLVFGCKFHHPVEVIQFGHGSRGVVGIVKKHQFGPFRHLSRYGIEVRQKIVFPQKGHKEGFPACKQGCNVIHRVSRRRNQGKIPGINKGQRKVCNSFLTAYQRNNLRIRVQVDPKPALIPFGNPVLEIIHSRI